MKHPILSKKAVRHALAHAIDTERLNDVVYAGFSLGVMPAQKLAQTRPGARGAVLMCAGFDPGEFGGWPAETVERLRSLERASWIRGNGERWTADPDAAPENPVVGRFVLEGQTARLSAAALETLPRVGPAMAARIISAQNDEIAIMQEWLRDQNQPVPVPNPAGVRMKMDGMEHDMLMPGMLTPEQMSQLDKARGVEFDRLFLTFMIQHHRGAVTMVHELFRTYGAGQDEAVFKFASDVQVDQSTEVARMEKMLAAMPAGGLSP